MTPYTPIEIVKYIYSLNKNMPAWEVFYYNYLGHKRLVWVIGIDELAAYVHAMKVLNRYKAKADKRKGKPK